MQRLLDHLLQRLEREGALTVADFMGDRIQKFDGGGGFLLRREAGSGAAVPSSTARHAMGRFIAASSTSSAWGWRRAG